MRIHDSIKNIFLLIVFVCMFFVQVGVVNAVEVDDNGLIDYTGGSYYSDNTWQNKDGKAKNTLYSSVETEKQYWVDNNKANVLGNKIKEAGSTFDISKLSQKNTYSINTANNSSFYYDPTPDNKTNNDEQLLAVATNKGQLYVPPTPIPKESKKANNFLDRVDTKQGLTPGTTVSNKNKYYDLKKEQEKISVDVATIDQQISALEEQLKNPQIDAATRDSINKSIDELKKTRSGLEEKNTNVLTKIDAEKERRGSTATPVEEYQCELLHPLNCVIWTAALLSNIVFKLTSFLAYVAGTLFDYSLELSINSAEFFKKLGVIEITWSFIRDILNMTFIFILLWTAIQILITNDAKYNAKKILINVIIVAILMNFSLFAAKLMVDGSNVVSLKIYEAMKANTEQKGSSISVRVMDTVGISSLYNISDIFSAKTIQAEGTCAKDPVALITVSVMGSIFLIVLILALGLAAILFLIRLVNIIYLFIKSPLWVWGYVIPGNKMMEKLKNDWQSEMKHVLLFPIVYLFWMLIAVIIFEKLGTATKGGGLLNLICNSPGAVGAGEQISLVAIFVIVIIFMMKAVEYGVKHASDGGSDALGQGATNWATKKFGGYQTAMTKGLANRVGAVATTAGTIAKTAAVSASVGATKIPLRLAAGGFGGIKSKWNGESFWKGTKDGFSNPSINLKETVGNFARDQALNGGVIGSITGLNKAAGRVAKKYEDPVNILGETRKKADERRTKSTVEHQNNINSAIERKFKIPTQEEWEKKYNNGNKIVTDEDAEKFEVHINNIVQQRTDAVLGKGVAQQSDSRDKPAADGSHMGGRSHLEIMKSKITKRENVLDDAGNIIGKKVKLDELAMHDSMMDILNYRTKGEGAASFNLTEDMTKLEPYANKKAEARIKTVSSGIGKAKSGVLTKNVAKEELEKLEKTIQKMKKIQELGNKTELEKLIGNGTPSNSGTLYKGPGDNDKTIIEFNKKISELQNQIAYDPTATANIKTLMDNAKKAAEIHQEHLDKENEKLVKKQNEFVKKLKAQEEADNKK